MKITTCTNCLGRGTVRIKHIIGNNADPTSKANFYYTQMDCPICNGLGYADNEGENYDKGVTRINSNNR